MVDIFQDQIATLNQIREADEQDEKETGEVSLSYKSIPHYLLIIGPESDICQGSFTLIILGS